MIHKIFKNQATRFDLIFQLSVIALAGFVLTRFVFLIRSWPFIDHMTFEWIYIFGMGLIYDMAFISYFYMPFVLFFWVMPNGWLYSTPVRVLVEAGSFLIIYSLGFSMVAEWFFWSEFGARFNFISVDYLVYRQEITDNILQSYPVFYILPIIFLFTLEIFFHIRPAIVTALGINESFKKKSVAAGILLMLPLLSFCLLNQSQRRLSENNYVNELASNGPYQLFAAFRNNRLDYRQFYATGDDQDLSIRLKKQVGGQVNAKSGSTYDIGRYITAKAPSKELNVILITVESLSAKFLTRFGQERDITPFMDQWFKQGLLFTRFYATGTRTTRGLEAMTLSIPPTPGRSIVKRPDNARMYSLGNVFDNMGYDTAFLYGGRGFFDNMNAFFSGNGYRIVDEPILSSNEITFKNAWGVCDEDIFNRTIREANQSYGAHKPFFFHIMTTSNHRPYTYPEGKIDLPPGKGGHGGSGRAGGVKYTDYALSQLMQKAKAQSWFDDTVFVVVADHCANSAGKVGLPVDRYHIPMFIYAPKYIPAKEINTLSSQMDLSPTLLALLNVSYDSFFFGKNILSPDFKGRALIANYQKLGLLTDKELLLLSPGKQINRVLLGQDETRLDKVGKGYPGVKSLMAYYQGADYVFTHRMNRLDPSSGSLAHSKTDSGDNI